ncbi:hypothetical protein ABZS29_09610 [Kribbella sp. NPDC005582]|uniref:hypothetical protein n=1 Tax=Kribbella sp. NPDC005582 TaxID=3156893 RepID=UPI0033BC6360
MIAPSEADAVLWRIRHACLGDDAEPRAELLAWLVGLPAAGVLQVAERARGTRYVLGPLGEAADWDRLLGSRDLLAACVASMHADGYLRERAVRVLSDCAGDLVARCLALRAVDHVEQVRRVALAELVNRPVPSALGVLLRVRERTHGAAALATYGGYFDLTKLLDEQDFAVRRFAYDGLMAGLGSGEVEARLAVENDQWSRRRLVEHWMSIDPVAAKEALLSSRYVEGRLFVLYDGTDELFQRSELEERLLDRSPRVRAAARWRYRRAGYDSAPYYRFHWESNGVASALMGLRETGQRFTEVEARTALASDEPRVRLAALHLWPDERPPKQVLLELLADPSGAVVKPAARLLARTPGIRYDDVAPAAASAEIFMRRAAWRVRCELGGWNRLRADLEALRDPDEELAQAASQDLGSWLEFHAASTFVPLLPSERDAIRSRLDQPRLRPEVAELIRFHTR